MYVERFFRSEAGHFLEWIGFETKEDYTNEYVLKVWLYARRKDNSIYQLRDALSEMTHGSKSRLAQILKSHSIFKKTKDEQGNEMPHELEAKYKTLKENVDDYFASLTESGKIITKTINQV